MSVFQKFDDWAFGLLASAPQGNPGMRELHRLHSLWLPTAELHRPYYGAAAVMEWLWLDSMDQPRLICRQEWTFVREARAGKHRTHLVTSYGIPSHQVFSRALEAAGETLVIGQHTEILTTRQPSVPSKPQMPAMIRGSLHDFG
jgi:hypothetical protein